MNRRITLYGIMAAAMTAVASGLVYSNAKSRLVAGLEAMEANPQEISSLKAHFPAFVSDTDQRLRFDCRPVLSMLFIEQQFVE